MGATTTLILGCGFGGISAANTLRSLLPSEHEIVVIDSSRRFLVGAGKTWIMLGQRTYEDVSRPSETLLAQGVRFVEDEILSIGIADRTVAVGSGLLRWDHLVIALGAEMDLTKVLGLAEAAKTFYTLAGAQHLKGVLERFSGGDVAIVIPRVPFKCPPAPYEAAMLMHDAFARRGLSARVRLAIHTAEAAPMSAAGPEMGQYVMAELAQRAIGFFPRRTLSRVDGIAQRLVFEDGSDARYDLLIAVPPHVAPRVARDARLIGPSGWIPVDPLTLRVNQHAGASTVYAIGDITTVPLPGRFNPDIALSLPKAGVFAEAHGRVAAKQIAATILGQVADETFDGKGYCFLETGGKRAVKAEGSFFEQPHPVMRKKTPDEAQLGDKLDWVERLLRPVR